MPKDAMNGAAPRKRARNIRTTETGRGGVFEKMRLV